MLQNRTVLLTGGSSGIGRAILDGLVAENVRVLVVSRRSSYEWPKPCDSLGVEVVKADFRDPKSAIAEIGEFFKRNDVHCDTVIQSACSYASPSRHPIIETLDEELTELINVNFYSQFLLLRWLTKALVKLPNALVVGISSDVARQPGPGRIAYACSKAASSAIHTGLAEELNGSGVSVVQLRPEKQVRTPGIESRRPKNFDFSGYQSPESFVPPIMQLVMGFGLGFSGKCLIIGERTRDVDTAVVD